MSEALGGFVQRARTDRGWWFAGAMIALGLSYPLIVEYLQDIPVIGDFVPATSSMVVMMIFTMMALGLNVVVGYAGLLDLGYVAFYAAGRTSRAGSRRCTSRTSRSISARPSPVTSRESTSTCGSSSSPPGSSRPSSAS